MGNKFKQGLAYFGLADEVHINDTKEAEPQDNSSSSVKSDKNVFESVHKSSSHKHSESIKPIRQMPTRANIVAGSLSEILTVTPTTYSEAANIAESFRSGVPVIMNLSHMPDHEAKRLIDFSSGLSSGLLGNLEKISTNVFLLTPAHISATTLVDDSDSES